MSLAGGMGMRRGSNGLGLFLLIFAGIVIGGFVGEWLGGYPSFSWLGYGKTFGLISPVVLDLNVLVLTFGLTIKFNITSIIGIVIAFTIYRRL